MITTTHWTALTLLAAMFGILNFGNSDYQKATIDAATENIFIAESLELTCPDPLVVEITENSCTKFLDLTAPDIPLEFIWVSYKATYTFNGIQIINGNTDLNPPDPVIVDVTPGGMSSVEFYGGDNTVEYVATDMGGVEMTCSYTITVLDGFAPIWPDGILNYEFSGRCGIDEAIDDIWLGLELIIPEDNCCNAKSVIAPEFDRDTSSLCGGAIAVTFYVLGYDGSGDDLGGADDTPCTLGINPASPHFSDTLWITVNLIDTMPPVIEGAPGPDTISCSATPVMPSLTASDICLGDITDSIDIVILEDSDFECGNGAINRFITYQATVDDGCGNGDTVTWTVYFINEDDLVVDLGDDLLLCTENMHTLDAGAGAETYTWSTGENAQQITVDTTGSYYVTVTSGGCCAVDSIFLSFGMDVVLNASGGVLTCTETSVMLMSGVTTDIYAWTGPDGFVSAEANPIVSEAGTYLLTATSNEGCSGMDTVQVVYDTLAPDISAKFGVVDCISESIQILGASTTEGVTFFWEGPGEFSSSASDTSVQLEGDYTLTVTAPNGCQSSTLINNSKTISSPVITVITTLATNGFDGSAWVEVSGGQEPFEISWFDGQMTDTIRNLPIGKYFVEIMDANFCIDSQYFFIDPQTTICDLPSTLISSNTTFYDTLHDLNVMTPSLSSDSCIVDFFGAPPGIPLLGRTFLYNFEAGANTTTLSLQSGSDKKAFIFLCRNFEKHTEQVCVGVSDDDGNFTFDVQSGQYYIVIAGAIEGDYNFIIQENLQTTACDAASGQIHCGDIIVDAVSGLSFFSSETGFYEGCYRGPSNKFLGPEKVYKYEVTRPVTATFRMTAGSDMGVFLYNYLCASKCISVFEAMKNVPTEDKIELNPGLYFIIVDQNVEGDGKGFTLEIECADLDDGLWPDRRLPPACEFSDSSHNVSFPANSIRLPPSVIGTSSSVLVYFLSPDKRSKIGEPKKLSLSVSSNFDALGDKPGNVDTCGYLEMESITYAFKTDDNYVILGEPSYKTGSSLFVAGGNSELDSIIKAPGNSSILASVQPLEQKDIAFDTNRTEIVVQTSSNQTWEVIAPTPGGWIDSIGVGSNPSSRMGKGVDKIIVWHSKNTGDKVNRGAVRISFPILGEFLRVNLEQSFDTSSVAVKYVNDIPGIEVFPNPSNGRFYVKFPEGSNGVATVNVLNLNGQLIRQNSAVDVTNSNYEVNMLGNPSGVYLVEILLKDRAVVKKIVLSGSD